MTKERKNTNSQRGVKSDLQFVFCSPPSLLHAHPSAGRRHVYSRGWIFPFGIWLKSGAWSSTGGVNPANLHLRSWPIPSPLRSRWDPTLTWRLHGPESAGKRKARKRGAGNYAHARWRHGQARKDTQRNVTTHRSTFSSLLFVFMTDPPSCCLLLLFNQSSEIQPIEECTYLRAAPFV
jgi:hypothetical protein